VPADQFASSAWKQVTHGGGPFNLPTDIAFAASGETFMSDGYGNARVHKFSADGEYLFSWGERQRAGPVQPAARRLDRPVRPGVGRRPRERSGASLDQSGKTIWRTKLIGPVFFDVDDEDIVYIPGVVSIFALDGERLVRWGGPIHRSCHAIWVDRHRDLYVVQPGEWGRVRRVVKYERL
jgi:hypothetical protein